MRLLSIIAAVFLASASVVMAADGKHAEELEWSFNGPFGKFDRAQLQRGFLVYKDVCAACHGLKLMAYRNLSEPGGPEIPEGATKAIAAGIQVSDIDESGEPIERPAMPSDRFKSPYANEQAARAANNGALPPDLSVIIKARHGGADYIHALLTGYADAPADMKMNAGMNYNPYFAGGQIAMPNPLGSDDLVTYADGTKATKDQMSRDVAAFLTWASEPRMEERKQLGVKVMAFTFVLMLVLFAAYRHLWRDVAH